MDFQQAVSVARVCSLSLLRLFVILLLLSQCCSMPYTSYDDAVNAKCPDNKPHKCPPHSTCYGRYQYCSSTSKTVEPCISEEFLEKTDVRKKQCQYIAQGQNLTKLIRHESCKVEEDCKVEFTALFLPSTQNDDLWITAAVCGCVALLLLCGGVLFLIWHCRKKAKRKRLEKEESVRMLANINSSSAVAILQTNRMNENIQENTNQRQQSTDSELGDTENTELMAHVRSDTDTAGNADNLPYSGITPYSAEVTIHTDSSSVSGSNRNSTSDISSDSIGSEPQEENRHCPAPHGHPADTESSQQRGFHMPSSEPHGSAQLVTSQTPYDCTNNNNSSLE